MQWLVAVAALAGCGWTNTNLAPAPPPRPAPPAPPPDPWVGIERLELEMHPLYSLLPHTTTVLSDGRELWTYEDGEACRRQFLVAGPVIQGRRLAGSCPPRCAARPTSRPCTPAEADGEQRAAQSAETRERVGRALEAYGKAARPPPETTTDCREHLGGVRCVTR